MTVLRIDGFSGIAPLIDPKKLPDGGAQDARECVFDGTDLCPVNLNKVIDHGGAVSAEPRVLLQYRTGTNSAVWRYWTGNCDVVPSPEPADENQRLYWSRGNGLPPRFATRGEIVNTTGDMAARGTVLGVDPPTQAPTVAAPDTEGPSVVAHGMSQTSPVRVTLAMNDQHPFKNGQRVVVMFERGPQAPVGEDAPPARVGMSEMAGKEFIVKTINAGGATDTRSFDLIGANGADYSEYNPDIWRAVIRRVYSDQDMDTRSYVYTFVSSYGEESQPSDASEIIEVRKDEPVSVTVFGPGTPRTVRLYRSVTGVNAVTAFYFVKEASLAGDSMVITDDVPPAGLGEMLPSETWAKPPNGLTGLTLMPNGFMAGFVGNTLYFCEPYQPHAWPLQYTRTTADDIVGLAVYGQTLVVATRGKPYIATGADPASVTLQQLDVYAPCLTKRSITGTGTGVIYASTDGLVHISSSGVRDLTAQYLSKDDWNLLIVDMGIEACAWHDGRYVLSAGNWLWYFQPVGERLNISRSYGETYRLRALAASTVAERHGGKEIRRDTLMAMSGRLARIAINPVDGDPQVAMHVGKIVNLPRPVSFGAGQVYADAYPVWLSIHAGKVTSAGGEPGGLQVPPNIPNEDPIPGDPNPQIVEVNGPEPFRLSGDFMAREWRVDVSGQTRVQGVVLATTMAGIRSA